MADTSFPFTCPLDRDSWFCGCTTLTYLGKQHHPVFTGHSRPFVDINKKRSER